MANRNAPSGAVQPRLPGFEPDMARLRPFEMTRICGRCGSTFSACWIQPSFEQGWWQPLCWSCEFGCLDCGVDTAAIGEFDYIVRDELWPIDYDGGKLCIGCLERRLGRRLVASDFDEAPVNDPTTPRFSHSRRLLDRLTTNGRRRR